MMELMDVVVPAAPGDGGEMRAATDPRQGPGRGPQLAMQLLGANPDGAWQLRVRRVSQEPVFSLPLGSPGGFAEMLGCYFPRIGLLQERGGDGDI